MQNDKKTKKQQLLVRILCVSIAVPLFTLAVLVTTLMKEQEERREWVIRKMIDKGPLHEFLASEYMRCRLQSRQVRSLCIAPLAEAARIKGYKRKDIQLAFSDLETLEQQAEREVDYFGLSS